MKTVRPMSSHGFSIKPCFLYTPRLLLSAVGVFFFYWKYDLKFNCRPRGCSQYNRKSLLTRRWSENEINNKCKCCSQFSCISHKIRLRPINQCNSNVGGWSSTKKDCICWMHTILRVPLTIRSFQMCVHVFQMFVEGSAMVLRPAGQDKVSKLMWKCKWFDFSCPDDPTRFAQDPLDCRLDVDLMNYWFVWLIAGSTGVPSRLSGFLDLVIEQVLHSERDLQ